MSGRLLFINCLSSQFGRACDKHQQQKRNIYKPHPQTLASTVFFFYLIISLVHMILFTCYQVWNSRYVLLFCLIFISYYLYSGYIMSLFSIG